MFWINNGGITDQHDNGEAPIKTQEEIPEKATNLIKQLRNDGTPKPHIRIDIPNGINDYPRVYIDGKNLSDGTNRAIQKLLLNYNTGNATSKPIQNIDIQYIERDDNHDWCVKNYKESTIHYEANADKKHQPKIHELPEHSKTIHVSGLLGYYNIIDSPKAIALLRKPNTRLVIIEDDTNA